MPVLKMFYGSIDGNHDLINGYYNDNDIENYTIKVHALKNSARIVGADLFADKAQDLENAGKEGNEDFIREHNGAFLEEYIGFKELLAGLFENEDAACVGDKPTVGPSLMTNVYEEIKRAADGMDCDTLESIFEEMKEYAIPEEEKELYARLEDATGRYDYDLILNLLSEEKGI